MTLDEALSAAVLGERVRHDGMQPEAYIYYDFNGWRIQFVHEGRLGSSSGWSPYDRDQGAEWYSLDPAYEPFDPDAPEAPPANPWLAAGIVAAPKQEGWAVFNEGSRKL